MKGMNIDPEKLQDMVRSILPSKNREAARTGKALIKRRARRAVRGDLHNVDFEETKLICAGRRR
jgi:hypothetical protein